MSRQKYKRKAGIIMVTSKKTMHTYIIKSMNIHFTIKDLNWRLKKGLVFEDLQKEYDEYGAKHFSIGILEEMHDNLDESHAAEYKSWIEDQLKEKFMYYIADIKPHFNKRYRYIAPMQVYERKKLEEFCLPPSSGRAGRPTRDILTNVKGIFVITHRKSRRQHIGYSVSIGNKINELRNNVCKIIERQEYSRGGAAKDIAEDWKSSGEKGFIIEYMETASWTRQQMKNAYDHLFDKLKPYYSIQARAKLATWRACNKGVVL